MEVKIENASKANTLWMGLMVFLLFLLITASGCRGIYRQVATATPEAEAVESKKDWNIIPIGIRKTETNAVQVDLAIHNESDDWSVMSADNQAILTTKSGERLPCSTVKISSGGHYIPPNFQLRGFTLKDKSIQKLHVICNGTEPSNASQLSVTYSYMLGEYDYYAQQKNMVETTQVVALDAIIQDLQYPATSISGITLTPTTEVIPALNKCSLTLTNVARTEDGFTFQWQVSNPGEYGTLVHIGNPPLLGDDGIIYGHRVSPDIVQVPIADAKGTASFETKVSLPKEVKGLYMLLSVEQRRERLFASILMDLTQY